MAPLCWGDSMIFSGEGRFGTMIEVEFGERKGLLIHGEEG